MPETESETVVEELTAVDLGAATTTLDELKPRLEERLKESIGLDGCLSDVVERKLDSLDNPAAVAPFASFDYRLYSSPAATSALRSLLLCAVPGTKDATFDTALSAIARGSSPTGVQQHFCYLVGGQVRDILRGVLSTDIDFNYSCSATEVALACVAHEWPTKYKAIGPTDKPNYVLIGDEGSDNYLEGFSIHFNATKACYEMDFRQNMCLYDLTNDVIIDKTGSGVQDIRDRVLRLSCAAGESYEAWAAATITQGFKELRYIKFLLRAVSKGKPMATDAAECAFVIESLRTALRANGDALRGFWFGYALDAQLKSAEGVDALRAWVSEHGGQAWWEEAWVPLVRACGGAAWLGPADGGGGGDDGDGSGSPSDLPVVPPAPTTAALTGKGEVLAPLALRGKSPKRWSRWIPWPRHSAPIVPGQTIV